MPMVPAEGPGATEPETIKISAQDLIVAFEDNGVAADEKYKGKLLEVTGIVDSIDKDIADDAYVTLNDGGEWSFTSTQCYFKKDSIDQITSLSSGQEITIIGTCNGCFLNVILKDCKVK